jgi:triacylglycerol esterase/lipase EstA (alpha/beta hydrolase family)
VRRGVALLGGAALLLLTSPAAAEPEHVAPQGPAKVAFGPGFPHLVDHEWGFALGGFGGTGAGAPRQHFPVIFVHGNNVDAADWYVVRDDFRAAGWTDQELYALSYNGLGGENGTATMRTQPERDQEHVAMGWDGNTRITNNTVNVPDLYDFIRAVQAYTGSAKFSLVTHSLGVTLARKVLKDHPELRRDVVAFVGIAGGNHGTSFCPPGSEDQLVSCNEIAAGTPWLADLNGPDGADETFAGPKWLTVYDGGGAGDPAYAGPTYAASPQLRGADNRTYPGTYHNDLRIDPTIVAEYRVFLEQADAAARGLPAPAGPHLLARTG